MDNYTISSFPNQETERAGLIELKGELSIQNLHDIKAHLNEAFEKMDTIELLIYDASILDLAMLQYIFSLKKSESALGKYFKITFELDDDLAELIKHAGFKNLEKLAE